MALVKLVVETPQKFSQALCALLFESGAGAIEELSGGRRLVVYAATREQAELIQNGVRKSLQDAGATSPRIVLAIEVDEASDWDSAWTQHLAQQRLTPRLVIQPAFDRTPAPDGADCIVFDPKLAFGDGGHATTRLAAVALERACHARPFARVLDFGSGTGVLAFVALRSGAAKAWGIDNDPISVAAARRNAELNGLQDSSVFCLPSELEVSSFELIVANLEAPVLSSCRTELARFGAHAERMLLTGFLEAREPEIRALFEPEFELCSGMSADDWRLIELVPRG
jgi:ribosomal protein L11 methyltransferase